MTAAKNTSGGKPLTRSNHLHLWSRWVLANALGELMGLGATFAIGAGLLSGLQDLPGIGGALLSAALMMATGVVEGVIVGLAQWSVLRQAIQAIGHRLWIKATVLAALIAWLFGSIPIMLASLSSGPAPATAQEPRQTLVLLLASGMGLVAGLILSAAQWAVLRRHVARAWRWLPANAVAWAAGMPLIFAAVDLAQLGGSLLAGIAIMAAAITLAGAVVGAIHGVALIALASDFTTGVGPAAS
jgi:hypothetical protein